MKESTKIPLAVIAIVILSAIVWLGGWFYYNSTGLNSTISEDIWQTFLLILIACVAFGSAIVLYVMAIRASRQKALAESINASRMPPPPVSPVAPTQFSPEKITDEEKKISTINAEVTERRKRYQQQLEDSPTAPAESSTSSTPAPKKTKQELEEELERIELERRIAVQKRFIKDIAEGRIIIEPTEDEMKSMGKGSLGYKLKRREGNIEEQNQLPNADNDLIPLENTNLDNTQEQS